LVNTTEHGEITLLEMAHGRANAMDLELCLTLDDRLRELGASRRALVLTGHGKVFSAGVDLVRLLEGGADYIRVFLPALVGALERVFLYPAPLVVALNGHAVAGGCLLACGADHRLMAEGGGRIGVPELSVGVPFPAVALEIMRFTAAPQWLPRLVYGGATLLPAEALEAGLADEVVAPEELLDRAFSLAERMHAIPAELFEVTKRQVRRFALERIRQAEGDYETRIRDLWARPESLDAVRAYVARTLGKARG
jgi:enoyl-CoA hydratase